MTVVVPSVKNFEEDQLNSRSFPVFPGGIKNSQFPLAVDRLYICVKRLMITEFNGCFNTI